MPPPLKALLACALALAMAGPAAAHTSVRAYVQAPDPYYPHVVHVAPHYAPPSVYVDYRPALLRSVLAGPTRTPG